jgi:hypothetical protein
MSEALGIGSYRRFWCSELEQVVMYNVQRSLQKLKPKLMTDLSNV